LTVTAAIPPRGVGKGCAVDHVLEAGSYTSWLFTKSYEAFWPPSTCNVAGLDDVAAIEAAARPVRAPVGIEGIDDHVFADVL
jgi:hypothetical protein